MHYQCYNLPLLALDAHPTVERASPSFPSTTFTMDPFDFIQSVFLDDDHDKEEEEDLLLATAIIALGHEHGRQRRIAR